MPTHPPEVMDADQYKHLQVLFDTFFRQDIIDIAAQLNPKNIQDLAAIQTLIDANRELKTPKPPKVEYKTDPQLIALQKKLESQLSTFSWCFFKRTHYHFTMDHIKFEVLENEALRMVRVIQRGLANHLAANDILQSLKLIYIKQENCTPPVPELDGSGATTYAG